MNRKTVRWLDKNVGRPVTLILTLCRKLRDIFTKDIAQHKKPLNLLFIKLIEQGSTVLAYPALKRAESLFGRENLFFLVFKENRPILDILNIIPPSNVIEIDPKTLFTLFSTALKALAKIRKNKIEAVVDMEFFARASAIIAYLTGARIRVGLGLFKDEGPYRGDLFTHKLIYNPYIHTETFFVSLVEAVIQAPAEGNDPMIFKIPEIDKRLPKIAFTEEEKRSIMRKIEDKKNGPLGRPILLLNPNIGDLIPIRRWPEEHFIKLGKTFLEEFKEGAVVLTGNERERENTDRLAKEINGSVSIAGEATLKELLSLYSVADILVTNDSGPAHFAALTSVKSIVLFGPETPALYGVRNGKREIIEPNLVCSPCVNVYNHRQSMCHIGACMKSISPEDVYKKIKLSLEAKI